VRGVSTARCCVSSRWCPREWRNVARICAWEPSVLPFQMSGPNRELSRSGAVWQRSGVAASHGGNRRCAGVVVVQYGEAVQA